MMRMYDLLRIDHFRGFVAYWEVQAGEETALNGKWQPVPFYDFMNTLLKHVPSLPIFAEDLGSITPDVREAMLTYNKVSLRSRTASRSSSLTILLPTTSRRSLK